MKQLDKIGLSPTKWFSRKLLVFGIATVFKYFDKIDNETWLWVAAVYIGVQGALDFYKARNN